MNFHSDIWLVVMKHMNMQQKVMLSMTCKKLFLLYKKIHNNTRIFACYSLFYRSSLRSCLLMTYVRYSYVKGKNTYISEDVYIFIQHSRASIYHEQIDNSRYDEFYYDDVCTAKLIHNKHGNKTISLNPSIRYPLPLTRLIELYTKKHGWYNVTTFRKTLCEWLRITQDSLASYKPASIRKKKKIVAIPGHYQSNK